MTIHRRGFVYVTDDGNGLPQVIGRPEAMRLVKEANGGLLPAEYNFDVIRRHYWQFETAAEAQT